MIEIDAHAATRSLIDNTFSYLTWHEDVCEMVGFEGVSPIWKDDPAWYFWVKKARGGFLLRFLADEPLSENHYISMLLHYFPSCEEEAYQVLSKREQSLHRGEADFDRATNTPQFDAYEKFISQFVAAEIGFVLDADNRLKILVYHSIKNESQPVSGFLDLLISALNFQAKQHHQQAYSLANGPSATVFLSYSEPAFKLFLAEFELAMESFEIMLPNERSKRWQQFAHMEAASSMHGICSCHS